MRPSFLGRLALIAAVLAGGGALAAVTSAGLRRTPAAEVARSPTTSSEPPRRPAPALQRPWPTRVVARLGFVVAPPVLAGSGGTVAAVGIIATPAQPPSPEHLVAVDLRTGAVRTGAAVPTGSFVIGDGRRVFLVTAGSRGAARLRSIDLRSLSAGSAVALQGVRTPPSPPAMAFEQSGVDAGDLWVGSRAVLELLDPGSGRILARRVLSEGQIDAVAAEPDGRFVDVVLGAASGPGGADGAAAVLVEAVEATSARVVGTRSLGPSVEASLTPVPGGLWASIFDGQYAHLYSYREPLQAPAAGTGAGRFSVVPAPAGATLAGGTVILAGAEGVGCASPAGGRLLAEAPFAGATATRAGRPWTPFGGAGGTVFALDGAAGDGVWSGILAVTPPAACGL